MGRERNLVVTSVMRQSDATSEFVTLGEVRRTMLASAHAIREFDAIAGIVAAFNG